MLTRIIVSLVFLISCSMSALADYSAAKDDFDRLPDQAKSQIAISLIATGDFDGVFTNQYTDRLNTAIETFQSREGFPPTGVLDATQIAKLEERANEFLKSLGFMDYKFGSSKAHLLVPRALFDTAKPSERGFSFERNDST